MSENETQEEEKKQKKTKSAKKKKQDSIALAVWILALLIVALLFIINWSKISKNWNETMNKSKTSLETTVPNKRPQTTGTQEIDLNSINSEPESSLPLPEYSNSSSNKSESQSEAAPAETSEAASKTSDKNQNSSNTSENSSSEKNDSKTGTTSDTAAIPAAPVKPATRTAVLYFMDIDADGSITRRTVKRTVSKTDSPLSDTIKLLISGPTTTEPYKSLIPDGTKLIGASVKDGVANLNFNEAFQYNQNFGSDGFSAQLQQIVFTATEFPTVKSVQFLIEGEKRDFLTEGLWIGSPLSRSSF